MTPRLPGVLAAAMLLTPVVVLAGCVGFGVSGDREGKYLPEPDPARTAYEVIQTCKASGYPVVRTEVEGGKFRIRCAAQGVTVYQRRAGQP